LRAETILTKLENAKKKLQECLEMNKKGKKLFECYERYFNEYESILNSATIDDYFYVDKEESKLRNELFELLKKREELTKSGSSPEALREVDRLVDEKWKEVEELSSLLLSLEEKFGSEVICEEMRRRGRVCISFKVKFDKEQQAIAKSAKPMPIWYHPAVDYYHFYNKFLKWLSRFELNEEEKKRLAFLLMKVFNHGVELALGILKELVLDENLVDEAKEVLAKFGVRNLPDVNGWKFVEECLKSCDFGDDDLNTHLREFYKSVEFMDALRKGKVLSEIDVLLYGPLQPKYLGEWLKRHVKGWFKRRRYMKILVKAFKNAWNEFSLRREPSLGDIELFERAKQILKELGVRSLPQTSGFEFIIECMRVCDFEDEMINSYLRFALELAEKYRKIAEELQGVATSTPSNK